MNFTVAFPYMCATILCSDYLSQGCHPRVLSPNRQLLSFYGTCIELPSLFLPTIKILSSTLVILFLFHDLHTDICK